VRQWPHNQSSNPCKYKFTSLNCFKFWRIVNCEVGILLQKNKNNIYFDLWKLSKIEYKHTQVDLKSLVSPSPHIVRNLYVHVLSKFHERSHFCCPSKTWMNFILKADVPIRLGLLLIGSKTSWFSFSSKVGSYPHHLEYLYRILAASFLMGVYQVQETYT
jgi:hypothetical protein